MMGLYLGEVIIFLNMTNFRSHFLHLCFSYFHTLLNPNGGSVSKLFLCFISPEYHQEMIIFHIDEQFLSIIIIDN